MKTPSSPRLARALLRCLLPPRWRENVLGDLHEEYLQRRERSGGAARLWYWGQVLRSVVPGLRARLRDPARSARHGGVAGGTGPGHPARLRPGSVLAAELRVAARSAGSRPGLVVPWVATLAVGVGATTAIFTVVDGVLLRPLPYPEPDGLVALCESHPSVEGFCVASVPNARDWVDRLAALDDVGLGRGWPFVLERAGERVGLQGGLATAGLFRVLGATPSLGRSLEDRDHLEGNRDVALLSHGLWAGRFGSDPSLVGSTLDLDGRPVQVVGVLAPDFQVPGLEHVEVWTPLFFAPDDPENRGWRGFRAFGRLPDGVELDGLRRELPALAASMARDHPEDNQGWAIRAVGLHDHVVGSVRGTLTVFLSATFLLLGIACANVAALSIVRGRQRTRELAVRAALGAGRGGLVRLLVSESLVLALAGGLGGLLLAWGGVRAFLALAPPGVPLLDQVGVEVRVFGFCLALTALLGLAVALPPAFRMGRLDLRQALRRGDGGRGGSAFRRGLVVAEVGLALVLLAGAALLTRTFVAQARYQPGFDRERLLTAWVYITSERYPTGDDAVALFSRLEEEVAALPGVTAVGSGSAGPLFGGMEPERVTVAGLPEPPPGSEPSARTFDVSPGYFRALGVPVVRGRNLRDGDARGAPRVAVVNRAFVQRHLPDLEPLGRQIRLVERDGITVEVVGVVADVPPLDPAKTSEPEMYWPARQFARFATYLVVRTEGEPEALARVVEDRLASVEPELSVGSVRTFEAHLSRRLTRPRFDMSLLGAFAAVALVLSLVGVYGVVSHGVTRRTHEMGIRISLGARADQVVRLALREGVVLSLAGVALGAGGAWALARVMARLVPGVPPLDAATLLAASGVLAGLAGLASMIPARRAGAVDPVEALRRD